MTRRTVARMLLPFCALACLCPGIIASQRGPSAMDAIAVSEGRALAAAILELERRHGWIVTYEDPPYEWEGDWDDVTLKVSRTRSGNHRVLVPRTKGFTFSYTDADASRPADLLSSMLDQYGDIAPREGFRLERQVRVFHVIPTRSADAMGRPAARQSLLDTPVSLPAGERTVLKQVEMVVAQVEASAKVPLILGTMPGNLLTQRKVQGGARRQPARDVLVRALGATGRDLSWRLLCDAGAPRQCAFNVHAVQPLN